MKLTDADHEQIHAAIDAWHLAGADAAPISDVGYVYLAGKRAGMEAMRERAAKACASGVYDSDHPYDERTIDACIAAIRALEVGDE